MTEYQKIENKLLSLGYRKENGKGDHIKFFKDGLIKPISVSLNISGRSYTNVISQIRRVEPNFTLDKQPAKKQQETPEETKPDEMPASLPPWQILGALVRWTKPEERNWEKLSVPESIMNKPYHITGYKAMRDTALVQITETDSGKNFFVHPQDIDSWHLKKCSRCDKEMPENQLVKGEDNGTLLCADCAAQAVQKETKPDCPATGDTFGINNKALGAELENTLSEIEAFFKENQELLRKDASPADRQTIKEKLGGLLEKLPAKAKRKFLRDNPILASLLSNEKDEDRNEKNVTLKPFEAWTQFLHGTTNSIINKYPVRYSTKEDKDRLKKDFFGTAYSFRKITRTKPTINVINVTAKYWDVAYEIWSYASDFFDIFKDVYPKEEIVMLLCCPKADFRQYLVNNNKTDGKEIIQKLKELTGEDDRYFTRSEKDSVLPPIENLFNAIVETVNTVDNTCKTTLIRSVREQDEQNLETAQAFYKLDIIFRNRVEEYPANNASTIPALITDLQDRIRKDLNGQPVSMKITSLSALTNGDNMDLDRTEFYDEKYFDRDDGKSISGASSEIPSLLPLGFEKNTCLFRIYKDREGLIVADTHNPKDKDERTDYCCAIAESFKRLVEAGDNNILIGFASGARAYRESIKDNAEALSKFDNIFKELTNNNSTMEINYLDKTNPTSENEKAGVLTTRELIKELNSRGVSFEKLSITIKQDIDISNI